MKFSLINLFFVSGAFASRGLRAEDKSQERKLQPTFADELPESLVELTEEIGAGFENFPEPGYAKKKFYIYLSGPEVFLPNAVEAGEIAKSECMSVNMPEWDFEIEAWYPLDKAIENFGFNIETALRIYYANIDLMDNAHFTASNMVRFRGPSMDVGTAFEMGYVRALGKPVFGYYDAVAFYGAEEAPGTYRERVNFYNYTETPEDQFDKDGLEVEGFGGSDNLMMWGAFVDSGYPLVSTVKDACMNAALWIVEHGKGSMGEEMEGDDEAAVGKSP